MTRSHSALAQARSGKAASELLKKALRWRGSACARIVSDGDRVDDIERLEEGAVIAEDGHGLGVAQMGVHVHEADFAAEEGRRFGATEDRLRAAAIGDGPVHQARAVRKQEMVADEVADDGASAAGVNRPPMMARVIGRSEYLRPVRDVARMQQQFGRCDARREDRIARDGPVAHQIAR